MFARGHILTHLALPESASPLALAGDWPTLDRVMREAIEFRLVPLLKTYKQFEKIEHMLALRDGSDPEEEDGIWHDDGSRVLAFSWSLNFFGKPSGGTLGIRPRGTTLEIELGPFDPGTLIIFQTGLDGFEHRTSRVTHGKRLVCAGWCS
jgi:hypothetical protein